MAVLDAIGPQTAIVFVVAVIALVPVVLFRGRTSNLFVAAYGCLFVAAFATNAENLFLPDLLNLTEHVVGNMGAGVAFAVAAYVHRKRSVLGQSDAEETPGEMT